MKISQYAGILILLFSHQLYAQKITNQDLEKFEKKLNQAVQSVVDYVRGYNYYFEANQINTQMTSSAKVKSLNLAANLQYRIESQISVGGFLKYHQSTTEEKSNSNISLYAVGNYFFTTDVLNSYYAQLGIGIYNSNELSSIESSFLINFGKQWQLFERITYSPRLQLIKIGNNNSDFEVYPMSLSVWF